MMPLWYQSLSAEFQSKLENQEMIDLTFFCRDGSIGAHQIMIALSSSFLTDALLSVKVYDVDLSIIVPDLSVAQVSAFLNALYGGPVTETTYKTVLDFVELFYVDLASTGLHFESTEYQSEPITIVPEQDQVEEVQTEYIIPESMKIETPKYFARNLPSNAQLLQMPVANRTVSAPVIPTTNSDIQMMELVQVSTGNYKLVKLSSTTSAPPLTPSQTTTTTNQHLTTSGKRITLGSVLAEKKSKRKGSNLGSKQRNKSLGVGATTQAPGAPKTMVVCSVCRKTFTKRVFQIYHKSQCPGATGELMCDYCNETGFDTVNILSVHVRVAHIDESKPFVCGYCSAKFSTSNGRSCHRALKHGVLNSNKKEWPCEECGKRLTSKVKLLAHIKVVHRGEKGYSCSYCQRTFSTKFNQLTHEGLKHTGEKLYRCENCNITFDRKAVLRDHVDNVCPHRRNAPMYQQFVATNAQT